MEFTIENRAYTSQSLNINHMNNIHSMGDQKHVIQNLTPEVKVDLNLSKVKVENLVSKSKVANNKSGPKKSWIPKST